jgi:hypothetical protein
MARFVHGAILSKKSGRFLKKAAQKLLPFWACGRETSTA